MLYQIVQYISWFYYIDELIDVLIEWLNIFYISYLYFHILNLCVHSEIQK